MVGYHAAIWDRIPEEWRLAAVQCKCKERLVNNIHKEMMKYVVRKKTERKLWLRKNDNKIKNEFLASFNPNSSFCLAFDWVQSQEGYDYWSVVNKWINYYKQIYK